MQDNIKRRYFIKAAGATGTIGLAGCLGGGNDSGGNDSGGNDSGGNDSGGNDSGDNWTPKRNLTVIVPWGAGGGTDTATRAVATPAEKILHNRGTDININVENITGANGLNGARRVLSKPSDGYTLFANTQVLAANIALDRANFTLDDWAGICRVQHDTSWIYSSGKNGTGYNSIDALIKEAKNNDIQLGAVGGVTGAAYIIQFAREAGILDSTQIISYKDAGRMRTDVISGEIDGALGEIQEMQEQQKSGDINLLLVGAKEPIKRFRDVTAAGERGWKAYYGISRGINAKAGTPPEALDYWMNLWKKGMQSDRYQKLAKETLVDLRKGFLPQKKWMSQINGNIKFFGKMNKIYENKKNQTTSE